MNIREVNINNRVYVDSRDYLSTASPFHVEVKVMSEVLGIGVLVSYPSGVVTIKMFGEDYTRAVLYAQAKRDY